MTAFFFHLLLRLPVTLDFDAWYAGRSVLLLAVLFAVAAYGFRTALAERPIFSAARLEA